MHTKCIGIPDSEYQRLSASDEGWCCSHCHKEALPFHNCSTIFTASTLDLSLTPNSPCCNTPTFAEPQSPSSCTIYYSNCRSLVPKLDYLPKLNYLRTIATSATPITMALCETWLDDSISNSSSFLITTPFYSNCRSLVPKLDYLRTIATSATPHNHGSL